MALKLDLSQASYPTTTRPRQEINHFSVAKIILTVLRVAAEIYFTFGGLFGRRKYPPLFDVTDLACYHILYNKRYYYYYYYLFVTASGIYKKGCSTLFIFACFYEDMMFYFIIFLILITSHENFQICLSY
jgi:hypothetical protein